MEALYDALSLIAATPRMGKPRPELGRGLRSHPVGSHLVFYRVRSGHVHVTRVLHQHQDVLLAFRKKRRKPAKGKPEA